MRLGERIINDVVKQYLIGKKDGLTIDQIEEKLATKNGIELLEPYSSHLERETMIFAICSGPETDEFKDLLVLQRIAFDICCAKGVYPRPQGGKQLTPIEHQHLLFIGSRVEARLRAWQRLGA
jgi:hypothetical protein